MAGERIATLTERFCNIPTRIAQSFMTDGALMPYTTWDLNSRRTESSVSASIESKTHRVLVNRADADLTMTIVDRETEDLSGVNARDLESVSESRPVRLLLSSSSFTLFTTVSAFVVTTLEVLTAGPPALTNSRAEARTLVGGFICSSRSLLSQRNSLRSWTCTSTSTSRRGRSSVAPFVNMAAASTGFRPGEICQDV